MKKIKKMSILLPLYKIDELYNNNQISLDEVSILRDAWKKSTQKQKYEAIEINNKNSSEILPKINEKTEKLKKLTSARSIEYNSMLYFSFFIGIVYSIIKTSNDSYVCLTRFCNLIIEVFINFFIINFAAFFITGFITELILSNNNIRDDNNKRKAWFFSIILILTIFGLLGLY